MDWVRSSASGAGASVNAVSRCSPTSSVSPSVSPGSGCTFMLVRSMPPRSTAPTGMSVRTPSRSSSASRSSVSTPVSRTGAPSAMPIEEARSTAAWSSAAASTAACAEAKNSPLLLSASAAGSVCCTRVLTCSGSWASAAGSGSGGGEVGSGSTVVVPVQPARARVSAVSAAQTVTGRNRTSPPESRRVRSAPPAACLLYAPVLGILRSGGGGVRLTPATGRGLPLPPAQQPTVRPALPGGTGGRTLAPGAQLGPAPAQPPPAEHAADHPARHVRARQPCGRRGDDQPGPPRPPGAQREGDDPGGQGGEHHPADEPGEDASTGDALHPAGDHPGPPPGQHDAADHAEQH